jgi:hypothetical protein
MTYSSYRSACWLSISGLFVALGCSDSDRDKPPMEGDGAQSFVSHVAGESTSNGGDAVSERSDGAAGAAASASPTSPADEDANAGASRAIAEADIIQVQGDRLFALSAYSGLTVVDLADPSNLKVLGQYRSSATPFEMYRRGDIAYVMFNGFWSYEYDEDLQSEQWVSTARMLALDVKDPAAIELVGNHEIAGYVSDSRLVGDVLYLVTYEDGYCWRCEKSSARTRVASFDIADPAEFPKVDELTFDSVEDSWGPRSISVNADRMYVAGPTWSEQNEGSTIQVVDVSDASGALRLGAEVQVAGRIDNRWQMDEFESVLRVISQPGSWRTSAAPVVETFRIESTDQLRPLGSLEMRLPRPEDLQSVRFDGQRAYAITFERKDPLFTLDLSDPEHPLQVGELEIPGFVYHMEPRGDRVYGLGFDSENADGGTHVSIFDVSDLSAPVMLDRVNFGGQWADAVEDQDRIHKAFNLMLDQGLILVPFAGGEYDEQNCGYQYESGIQIIDVGGDDLSLRGQAPQIGTARRSLLHEGTLIGISDDSVQSFDISDRDAPRLLDKLEVARNVESMHLLGDRVLRFGRDWWTDRTMLDFTSKADANSPKPSGELDLTTVGGDDDTNACSTNSHFGEQVLVHGDTAYVARHTYAWDYGANGGSARQTMTIYVLDISGSAPSVVSSFEVEPATGDEWHGSPVLTDHALLIGRGRYHYYRDDGSEKTNAPKFWYDIYSLEDPRAPRYVERFEVPNQVAQQGWGYGVMMCGVDMGWGWWRGSDAPNTLVDGDILVSQHEEPLDDDSGRVRYYMDRLDVSDPDQPRMLEPVSIPGKVVHFDGDAGLIVTVEDDLRETVTTSYQDCMWRGSRAFYDWQKARDENRGMCRVYDRILNTLLLAGDVATRVGSANLDAERNSMQLAVSDSRVFVLSRDRKPFDDTGDQSPQFSTLVHSYAVGRDGALRLLGENPVGGELRHYWAWFELSARGERAFIQGENQFHIVHAGDDDEPSLATHDMPGWSCNSLQVDESHAWCAMGKQGVLAFDL